MLISTVGTTQEDLSLEPCEGVQAATVTGGHTEARVVLA